MILERPMDPQSESRQVWLVTYGEYSDYTVLAAFSTEAAAQAYAEEGRECQWSRRQVDAVPLDAPRDQLPGAWAAIIDVTGAVVSTHYRSLLLGTDETRPDRVQYDPPQWIGYGRTVEHARRSAEEYRRAQIASGLLMAPRPSEWQVPPVRPMAEVLGYTITGKDSSEETP